jgi:drug/metabolite transporter (DMT)-like permease
LERITAKFNWRNSDEIRKGRILIILAALAWGSSFPIVKWGLYFINPIIFVFFRFLPASFIAILFVKYLGTNNAFNLIKDRRIIILGVINALGYLLQFVGMVFTTASKASLLVNVNVVIVAVFSFFILNEKIGWRKGIAIIISILGVFLITTEGNLQILLSGSIIGDLIVIVSGAIWAYYIVYSKKVIHQEDSTGNIINSTDLSMAVIVITTLSLSIPGIIYGFYDPISLSYLISAEALIAILYTGVICTTLAFSLYYAGLKYVSASVSGIILLLEIVFAVILALIFLGEIPTFYTIIGGILIGSAIYLAEK